MVYVRSIWRDFKLHYVACMIMSRTSHNVRYVERNAKRFATLHYLLCNLRNAIRCAMWNPPFSQWRGDSWSLRFGQLFHSFFTNIARVIFQFMRVCWSNLLCTTIKRVTDKLHCRSCIDLILYLLKISICMYYEWLTIAMTVWYVDSLFINLIEIEWGLILKNIEETLTKVYMKTFLYM